MTEGLTPTQALARCRDVLIRHRSPAQERAAIDAVLQCACGFSPNLENTAPGTVTLDLRGLVGLTGRRRSVPREPDEATMAEQTVALQNWAARLRSAIAAIGLAARIGIGPTPNIARHAARWLSEPDRDAFHRAPEPERGDGDGAKPVPAGVPALAHHGIQIALDSPAFVASLPVAALEPSTDVAIILQKWGIRTIGEFLALGQDALTDRLGLEALALFAAASTTAMRPLHLVEPPAQFEETFDFEHLVETAEPLLFILNRFVQSLGQRLEAFGFVAEKLALGLRLDSGEKLECSLRVPEPTRRSDVLFRMLQTHLEMLRTDSPIASVTLTAEPTAARQKQFSLFEAALRDPHQFQETLARLSALVGADRVGTPVRENSHRPDAFKLVPPDFENAPGMVGQRVAEFLRATPLRRLRPAVKAVVEFDEPLERTPVEAAENAASASTPQRVALSSPPARKDNIIDLLGPLFNGPANDSGPNPILNRHLDLPRSAEITSKSKIGITSREGLSQLGSAVSPRPLSIQCKVAKGRLTIVIGPWRTSGHWWEPGAWQRDEWDVQTRDGPALRLVQTDGEWRVEAVVD